MEKWKWPIAGLVLAVCGVVVWISIGRMQDAKAKVRVMNDLKVLGLGYSNFQKAKNGPPKSFDELASFAANQDPPLTGGSREATVIWGAGMEHLCKDGPARSCWATRPRPTART